MEQISKEVEGKENLCRAMKGVAFERRIFLKQIYWKSFSPTPLDDPKANSFKFLTQPTTRSNKEH